ncbi:MAG: hypothetical protein M5U19_20865 [Microthrixaceae bacterium]|nr:hypothetical protein [Microthrixaceae bacterium]
MISNLTLAPTFLDLLGEDVIGADWSRLVKRFSYDDPQLLCVMYALSGDPVFASAAHDPAIQRSWVGYFGGETLAEMGRGFTDLGQGIIPDDIMGGWFIPTRADPTQAPPGCHTAYVWVSVPPHPGAGAARSWRDGIRGSTLRILPSRWRRRSRTDSSSTHPGSAPRSWNAT